MIPGPEGGWNLCKKEEKSKSYFVEMGQLQLYGLRRPRANDPGFKPNLRLFPLWIRFLQLYTSLIKVDMIVALLWQTLKSKKDT